MPDSCAKVKIACWLLCITEHCQVQWLQSTLKITSERIWQASAFKKSIRSSEVLTLVAFIRFKVTRDTWDFLFCVGYGLSWGTDR